MGKAVVLSYGCKFHVKIMKRANIANKRVFGYAQQPALLVKTKLAEKIIARKTPLPLFKRFITDRNKNSSKKKKSINYA